VIDDAFRIEVFVDKEGIVHDEVFIDKVGSDTSKWDYLLTLSPCSVNKLPKWLRRKLAVLKMRSYDPPTEDIPEIGRRMSKYLFWVYVKEGDTDGDNAREEG
tara:strand:+ start:5640 stop:5945 length:306 start_codon:yes stop_codon:yes gene_type:complete